MARMQIIRLKRGKELEETFLKRRHTYSQQAYEEVVSISNAQRNAS
jgi:hypothetical protein